MYTWGGVFHWVDPGEERRAKAAGTAPKKDNNKGCLGVGDKEGRLVPTRVSGDLENREVVQASAAMF